MGKRIESFEDLEVYQLALELQQEIFEMTKTLIRIQLGEGKRRCPAHFVSKLSDSDGEQNETRHWLRSAVLCEYVPEAHFDVLIEKCKTIGRKLGNMMQHPEKWVPKECR